MVEEGQKQAGLDTLVGQVLDNRFEILDRLGSGTMGEVYLARQKDLGALRAIKVIERNSTPTGDSGARFRREAQVLSRLHHSGIVQVIEFGGLPQGSRYLVMEYIAGPTLQEVVTDHGPLPPRDAMQVLLQLASALEYAHRQGAIHRDLKPPNILLRDGDPKQAKIVDFGLAKLVTAEALTQITADEQILGTPLYMSPEQCKAQEISPAVDIYSLAGIAYYLLSGKPVFTAPSVMGLFLAQTHNVPERLRIRCPDLKLPSTLDDLLLRCLEKDADQRPDAAEVLETLLKVHSELEVTERTRRAGSDPGLQGREQAISEQIYAISPQEISPKLVEDRSQFMRDALSNQITAVLEELGAELQNHLAVSLSLHTQLDQIARLTANLGDVEVEQTLLRERMGTISGDAELHSSHREAQALAEQVENLTRSLQLEHKSLFQYIWSVREQVTDPELLDLYDELDGLLDQYHVATVNQGPKRTLPGMP